MNSNFNLVLGLETHVELKTQQKMFCGCSASYFGKNANTNTCPVCLGLPGALPVPNLEAIKKTMALGLALNCQLNEESFFERKHYFYPDLTKGYQISQYQKPLCTNGYLEINGQKIRINRVHLEEDTGKLIHGSQLKTDPNSSFVDFNRSGVPLVEIVTEPDFESAEQAVLYLKKLQLIVQYLEISDADMEKGSMRCEPNISLKMQNPKFKMQNKTAEKNELPDYKVEVKNINSFRFVKKAVEYEFQRQSELLQAGKKPIQETRRFVEAKNKTETMRSKEEAKDYRYFPEPDIPPLKFQADFLNQLRKQLKKTELPDQRLDLLTKKLHLRFDLAEIFVTDKKFGDRFLDFRETGLDLNKLASFMVNQKKDLLNLTSVQIKEKFLQSTKRISASPEKIQETVTDVINQNPLAVADYRAGKENALQFLLGQCLKILGREVEVSTVLNKLKAQVKIVVLDSTNQ